jgi:hypothetical protein
MRKTILFGITVLATLLAGCAPPENAPSAENPRKIGDVYDTEFPLSALDYTTLLNKEAGLVLHKLSSHMSASASVVRGEYPAKDEVKNAEHSIAMVEESIISVTNANPAKTYEDDRLEVLRLMKNAKASLEAYKEALEAGDGEMIEKTNNLMKGDFVALSGMFNVMWE